MKPSKFCEDELAVQLASKAKDPLHLKELVLESFGWRKDENRWQRESFVITLEDFLHPYFHLILKEKAFLKNVIFIEKLQR